MMQANTPKRPLPLMLAVIALVFLGLGLLYATATHTRAALWVKLAMPLMMALWGVICWAYPDHFRFPSPAWRRGFIISFFAMSALILVLNFV